MPITQRQIALEANVSRSTVAAILANRRAERFSDEVRQRVLEIARSRGYRPNRYAQVISRGRSGVIGILSFGGGRYIPSQKVKVAVEALQQAGYNPLVHDVSWYGPSVPESVELLIGKMLDAKVEGLLFVHPNGSLLPVHFEALRQAAIPLVSIGGEHLDWAGIPLVLSDRIWGYRRITTHLLSLGYRRLALLRASAPAEQGFRAALAAHSGPVEPPIIFSPRDEITIADGEIPERFSHRLGYHGMRRMLERQPRPDAVICTTDSWAIGALRACTEMGVCVPEEIALTGYEDEPASEYGSIPITTLSHPLREIAEQAVGQLLALVRSGESPVGSVVPVRGLLQVRQSCGATLRKPVA